MYLQNLKLQEKNKFIDANKCEISGEESIDSFLQGTTNFGLNRKSLVLRVVRYLWKNGFLRLSGTFSLQVPRAQT